MTGFIRRLACFGCLIVVLLSCGGTEINASDLFGYKRAGWMTNVHNLYLECIDSRIDNGRCQGIEKCALDAVVDDESDFLSLNMLINMSFNYNKGNQRFFSIKSLNPNSKKFLTTAKSLSAEQARMMAYDSGRYLNFIRSCSTTYGVTVSKNLDLRLE